MAKRRGLDLLRRQSTYRTKLSQLGWSVQPAPDDRLKLIFTCCHPALAQPAQIALTLRVVCGLTTAQIAAAFLQPEKTVAQRITRAKRKITDAANPYRIPQDDELPERLSEVLTVVYLLFNEGYLSSTPERAHSRDLVDEAEWLTALLTGLLPKEPEIAGLLSLIHIHRARTGARFTADGQLILLQDQDSSRWDHQATAAATTLLTRAALRYRSPGLYQLQAAIAACHCEAATWDDTDWPQILVLYDMLLRFQLSPVTRLRRVVAVRYVRGVPAALAELDQLANALQNYPLYYVTRAELLRATGHHDAARHADQTALDLTQNPAQADLLQHRITLHQ